jgi:hypothetical protein
MIRTVRPSNSDRYDLSGRISGTGGLRVLVPRTRKSAPIAAMPASRPAASMSPHFQGNPARTHALWQGVGG